jgi:tetratricopeptide (TPR) repeat protein
MRIVLICAVAAACALAQQQAPPKQQPGQQKRDLKIEKIEDESPTLPTGGIPRSYAVIVGISRYQKLPEKSQLHFPQRDAESIYTVLISPEGGNFKQENVHMLTGAKATLAAVRHEIGEWLPSVAKDGDRVLIYFAGHGFLDRGKGYLAPFDIDPANISATGYPMDELGVAIGTKIHAKSKILLTDACHSGAITPADTENLNGQLANLDKSLFSFTASRANESSFESPDLQGGHGFFTYYVVRGLAGEADVSPRDGTVTADELAEYVHTEVRNATGTKQNPTSDRANYDPRMLLAYLPANAPPPTAPAPKVGTLVFETTTEGDVEVFLDGNSVGTVAKGKPLTLPGLQAGSHTVKGVRNGYEPDGPRPEPVTPGQESTVTFVIRIPRHRDKAATELLDKGVNYYQKGYEENYKKAAELFERAFKIDPTYSQVAAYLGLTYNALFDEEKSAKYYQKAIEIDPDFLQAHADYAGMLLDTGGVDEAIRQINTVLTLQPRHALAFTMLAQANRFKDLYPQSIEAARQAIQISPNSADPHLWMADSMRLSGQYAAAEAEYAQYLSLSDFNSKLAGQLNYYVLGALFGLGAKHRAAETDIWGDLRSLAYFGICDCERKVNKFDSAIGSCVKALTYSPKDPYAHYALGLAYMGKAKSTRELRYLDPALKHFEQMMAINPDLDEAKFAKQDIDQIHKLLQTQRP